MARTIAKDHDQKRAQILRSAAKVFADQGFDRASMSQLARECGISKANIYHYYDSKDALLFDLLDTYLSGLRDRICGTPLDGLSPEDKLRATISATLKAYQGADDEHRVQTTGIPVLPPEQQDILRAYQRDMVKHMSDLICGIAPDVFENDRGKLYSATMSVFGMLNWFYMWNSKAGEEVREEYAQLVSNLTLKGVHGL
ncbi:DNA-binding transcriptional regulator, AcrR family [Salinihabitans flavidus]|uniref:DNA-binding transcriptional regulator, AcrR family n=1 Tax=Salinihabitans flavidus TaxID=569882 RepID=A0A1H8LJD9_9RHOB|nr:TetR/AcrR family transcriptional regulator [Salinihabitans flavidus]SEO05235.1 DNA-binding transcriptional regulator, AcrR family [Salinihabitans flavidus]